MGSFSWAIKAEEVQRLCVESKANAFLHTHTSEHLDSVGLRMSGLGGVPCTGLGVSAAFWGLRSSKHVGGFLGPAPPAPPTWPRPPHLHSSVSCSTSLSDFRPVLVLYSREREWCDSRGPPEPSPQGQSRVREPSILCFVPISGCYCEPASLSIFPVIVEPMRTALWVPHS